MKLISGLFKTNASKAKTTAISEEVNKQNQQIKLNDSGIFSYNSLGFEIDLPDGFRTIRWDDIERIEVYKADLMTTDEICMDIIFDNRTIIITEETKGWYQFLNRLESVLPLTNKNWQAIVLETPFEYNLTTVYERADRKMPSRSNFYSYIKGNSKEDIIYMFQKQGWNIRKSSIKEYVLTNSWTELVLQDDNGGLLLNGRIAWHPENVKIIRQLFDSLNGAYKFEFYDNDQLLEQFQSGM